MFLSHPTQSRKAIRSWQMHIKEDLNVCLLNPFYDFKDQEVMTTADICNYNIEEMEEHIKNFPHLVLHDLKNLLSCNAVVAIFDENYCVGVPMEMVYAKNSDMKVYSIVVNGRHNNPFIRYFSDKVYLSFDEFANDFTKKRCKKALKVNEVSKKKR